ncbi:YIP1 family protein [Candidatus Obscuribacterales bacterium]|nr:YIP1 family protein [Candidatus Obscuribacterales bacterium]
MSDPSYPASDPDQDDERRNAAGHQRLDVSGSFQTAQNPDAFFQGAIDLPSSPGPDQQTAFMRTEGGPGAHSSVPAQGAQGSQPQSGGAHGNVQSPMPQNVARPGEGEGEIPVYDPRIVEEQRRRAAAAAAAAAQAAAPPPPPMSGPEPPGMGGPSTDATADGARQNAQRANPPQVNSQSASKGVMDFFDESNRTAVRQGPAQPSTPQAMAGIPQEPPPPGYSFETFLSPESQDPRRVPGGFFDAGETPGTASGGQADSRSGGTGGAGNSGGSQPTLPAQQSGGMTAQQAFFFDGQGPPPSPQPPAPQEGMASFDSFQQSSSAPQQSYNGAPPQSHSGAPPQSHSGAPPQSHSGGPPQSHSGAPPHSEPPQSGGGSNQFPDRASTASQYLAPGVNQEVSEETLAERAQRQYDEYLEQMARQAAAPQQFYDPHEKAYQDSANTDRAAAEAIAQAAALSDGLGDDVIRRAEINALPDTFLNLPKKRKPAPPPEPPKRVRRVQPPPEAFYDETDEDERSSDPNDKFARFERLMTPETKGVVMFTMHQVKEILTQPEVFFKKMPQKGNLAEPALFFFIVAAASGLLAGVLNFNLLVSIQFILGNVLQTFALSFVVWKLCIGLGSAESYESNFRVIAYSQAALVIAGLQFSFLGNHIPGYIMLLISLVMTIRLQLIGLRYVHDLSQGKLILITVLPTILILIIRSKTFLLF